MPKATKKPVSGSISNEELALRGIEYVSKQAAKKELDNQLKECRAPLEDAVSTMGKTTANGSRILAIPYADKEVQIHQTYRAGKVLLPEAIDVLHKYHLDEAIEEVPTIREDVLERLYDEGKVPDEVLRRIYQDKPSFAFSVKVVPRYDAPEGEE